MQLVVTFVRFLGDFGRSLIFKGLGFDFFDSFRAIFQLHQVILPLSFSIYVFIRCFFFFDFLLLFRIFCVEMLNNVGDFWLRIPRAYSGEFRRIFQRTFR